MTHDTPDDTPAPDLRKAEPTPQPAPVEPPASIWQPLDGSAPPPPPVQPLVNAWGQPHQPSLAPHQVVAAYSGVAAAVPGGATGVFTLAGWGNRFLAYLIDFVLFGIVSFVLVLPIGMWQGLTLGEASLFFSGIAPVPETVADPTVLYVGLIVRGLLVGIFSTLFLAAWNGQTPGKRAAKIRVMRSDGAPLDLTTAFRRELIGRTLVVGAAIVLSFGVLGLANYLWPLWDKQRRTGHDALAGTRVVTAPPEAPPASGPQIPQG